jgi:hypothetical protein
VRHWQDEVTFFPACRQIYKTKGYAEREYAHQEGLDLWETVHNG